MDKIKGFVDEYIKFRKIWCNRKDNPRDVSEEVCLKAFSIYKKKEDLEK